ncbi:Mitochondrial Ribosomal Protein Large [Trichostrongylus colubriformis]|uniref:Mitochondrial Ribosomal Protein Large n=1 Tax=Trichostrongylus colubriformis TaxID=6319 RepID=A0AAN8FRL2_TRICO
MVFRKYRPAKQWGKVDTRVFKAILKARNLRNMPRFRIPAAVEAAGLTVYDPNDPSFFTPIIGTGKPLPDLRVDHPAFRVPSIEEHPLYHSTRCFLFDGTTPMSDGVDQAAVLSKAIVREGLPETVIHHAAHVDIPEDNVRDAILHGEKYDPTLEKLPRRFDPVLFWIQHIRVHGTPVIKRLNIILDNLSRSILFSEIRSGLNSDHIRLDRDEPLSATLPTVGSFAQSPLVLRFQPHITLQGSKPITAWATSDEVEETSQLQVANIAPLSPLIDLGSDHIYNDRPVVARPNTPLALHAILWSREQDQKYPWTKEQNAANAVMHTFGAAVAEATRRDTPRDLKRNPVVVKGVQIVDGKVDLIAFQLNTLNLSSEDSTKNIVWVEKACPLYKPKPFYEQLTEVPHVNMDTWKKFVALLWNK